MRDPVEQRLRALDLLIAARADARHALLGLARDLEHALLVGVGDLESGQLRAAAGGHLEEDVDRVAEHDPAP